MNFAKLYSPSEQQALGKGGRSSKCSPWNGLVSSWQNQQRNRKEANRNVWIHHSCTFIAACSVTSFSTQGLRNQKCIWRVTCWKLFENCACCAFFNWGKMHQTLHALCCLAKFKCIGWSRIVGERKSKQTETSFEMHVLVLFYCFFSLLADKLRRTALITMEGPFWWESTTDFFS